MEETLSYNVIITGTTDPLDPADAQAIETGIIDTIKSALAALPADAGLASASGSFDVSGSVNLAPTPPPVPGPSVDDARKAVDDAVDALAAVPSGQDTTDAIATLQAARAELDKAITDSETNPATATADAAPDTVFAL